MILETFFLSTLYMKAEEIKIMRGSLLECQGFGGTTLSQRIPVFECEYRMPGV